MPNVKLNSNWEIVPIFPGAVTGAGRAVVPEIAEMEQTAFTRLQRRLCETRCGRIDRRAAGSTILKCGGSYGVVEDEVLNGM